MLKPIEIKEPKRSRLHSVCLNPICYFATWYLVDFLSLSISSILAPHSAIGNGENGIETNLKWCNVTDSMYWQIAMAEPQIAQNHLNKHTRY